MGLPLITLEIFLGFGVPLAWGIWELLSLRREKHKDALRRAAAATAAAPAPAPDTAARGPPAEG